MTLISAQSYMAVVAFTGLVKDKSLLAAEVMREYDQKVSLLSEKGPLTGGHKPCDGSACQRAQKAYC